MLKSEIKENQHLIKTKQVLIAKDLTEMLNNIPDDAIICTERVEDIYFNKYDWTTIDLNIGSTQETSMIKSFSCEYDKKRNYIYIFNHF